MAVCKKILKDVSRSFYLSIRVLPKAMREPVSLGYLLARASDTLADTAELDPDLRADLLNDFSNILQGADASSWISRIKTDVLPHQTHEGERVLMENISSVLDWFHSLADQPAPENANHYEAGSGMGQSIGARHQQAILTVMSHILKGQGLDIERFELRDDFRFTLDAELEEYCYLVAGCVGEFWTDVGEISLGNFSRMETSRLRRWGANYGKGLQLINILRDLPQDLKNGRCYLPAVDPSDKDALIAESRRWRARARTYLEEGHDYACSLLNRRTRAATALPGLIGERTLDQMDAANWAEMEQRVKIPRSEVYRCAWEALFV
ncbi:MAG: phytoene/squalene synthase family protein [Akkermansiaceae bacterium]